MVVQHALGFFGCGELPWIRAMIFRPQTIQPINDFSKTLIDHNRMIRDECMVTSAWIRLPILNKLTLRSITAMRWQCRLAYMLNTDLL